MSNQTFGTGTRTLRSARIFHKKKKKVFYIDQKQNQDGRFIKITEACDGKRDTIVFPIGLSDALIRAVEKVRG